MSTKLWEFPFQKLFENYTTDVAGQGFFNDLNLTTRLQLSQQGGENLDYLQIESRIKIDGENLYSSGDMTFYASNGELIDGNYAFSNNSKKFEMDHLSIGDNLNFKFKTIKQSDSVKTISGNLKTSSFLPKRLFIP